jgi:hypothetical membrane protein
VLINQLIGMFCAQAQLHVLIYIYIYIYGDGSVDSRSKFPLIYSV